MKVCFLTQHGLRPLDRTARVTPSRFVRRCAESTQHFQFRYITAYSWLIVLVGLVASGCGTQFNSPPQILTGGLNSRRADESPAYSSDGRYLAFASDRDQSRDIFLYDLQQKRLINLPNLNRRDSSQDQPALSADGRFIAYVSNERGKKDILVYDRQTQRSQLLTGGVRGSVRHPTITGNGRYVAYETSQLGQWHIAIVEQTFK